MTDMDAALMREAIRLEGGGADTSPRGVGKARFVVRTSTPSAVATLEKVRESLRIVNAESRGDWPTEEHWRRVLPKWFLDQCAKERTKAEADAWLARWKKLSMREKEEEERDKKWSLRNWLYWMNPDQRAWYWWDAVVVTDSKLLVAIEVEGWPFPWGAFTWLFRAAGAAEVSLEQDAIGDDG